MRDLRRALGYYPLPAHLMKDKLAATIAAGPCSDRRVILTTNDNWKETQEIEIEATGLDPADDHEARSCKLSPAGADTAIGRGVADTVRVRLVEVYNCQTDCSASSAGNQPADQRRR
jgi:hypothetical protein